MLRKEHASHLGPSNAVRECGEGSCLHESTLAEVMRGADSDHLEGLTKALHAADISNAAKPQDICIPWGCNIAWEMWREGMVREVWGLTRLDWLGKEATDANVAASQAGFITNWARSTFEGLQTLAPNTAALALADCAANLQHYTAVMAAAAAAVE